MARINRKKSLTSIIEQSESQSSESQQICKTKKWLRRNEILLRNKSFKLLMDTINGENQIVESLFSLKADNIVRENTDSIMSLQCNSKTRELCPKQEDLKTRVKPELFHSPDGLFNMIKTKPQSFKRQNSYEAVNCLSNSHIMSCLHSDTYEYIDYCLAKNSHDHGNLDFLFDSPNFTLLKHEERNFQIFKTSQTGDLSKSFQRMSEKDLLSISNKTKDLVENIQNIDLLGRKNFDYARTQKNDDVINNSDIYKDKIRCPEKFVFHSVSAPKSESSFTKSKTHFSSDETISNDSQDECTFSLKSCPNYFILDKYFRTAEKSVSTVESELWVETQSEISTINDFWVKSETCSKNETKHADVASHLEKKVMKYEEIEKCSYLNNIKRLSGTEFEDSLNELTLGYDPKMITLLVKASSGSDLKGNINEINKKDFLQHYLPSPMVDYTTNLTTDSMNPISEKISMVDLINEDTAGNKSHAVTEVNLSNHSYQNENVLRMSISIEGHGDLYSNYGSISDFSSPVTESSQQDPKENPNSLKASNICASVEAAVSVDQFIDDILEQKIESKKETGVNTLPANMPSSDKTTQVIYAKVKEKIIQENREESKDDFQHSFVQAELSGSENRLSKFACRNSLRYTKSQITLNKKSVAKSCQPSNNSFLSQKPNCSVGTQKTLILTHERRMVVPLLSTKSQTINFNENSKIFNPLLYEKSPTVNVVTKNKSPLKRESKSKTRTKITKRSSKSTKSKTKKIKSKRKSKITTSEKSSDEIIHTQTIDLPKGSAVTIRSDQPFSIGIAQKGDLQVGSTVEMQNKSCSKTRFEIGCAGTQTHPNCRYNNCFEDYNDCVPLSNTSCNKSCSKIRFEIDCAGTQTQPNCKYNNCNEDYNDCVPLSNTRCRGILKHKVHDKSCSFHNFGDNSHFDLWYKRKVGVCRPMLCCYGDMSDNESEDSDCICGKEKPSESKSEPPKNEKGSAKVKSKKKGIKGKAAKSKKKAPKTKSKNKTGKKKGKLEGKKKRKKLPPDAEESSGSEKTNSRGNSEICICRKNKRTQTKIFCSCFDPSSFKIYYDPNAGLEKKISLVQFSPPVAETVSTETSVRKTPRTEAPTLKKGDSRNYQRSKQKPKTGKKIEESNPKKSKSKSSFKNLFKSKRNRESVCVCHSK